MIRVKTMNVMIQNAYFYGYYFYFAVDCEAVSRM